MRGVYKSGGGLVTSNKGVLHVGTYEKQIVFSDCETWRHCAQLVAKDIDTWLEANALD